MPRGVAGGQSDAGGVCSAQGQRRPHRPRPGIQPPPCALSYKKTGESSDQSEQQATDQTEKPTKPLLKVRAAAAT